MKRQYMDKVLISAMLSAAGILMLMSLLGLWKIGSEQTKQVSNAIIRNLSATAKEISESDITKYEGLTIMGSDVINFYKKYLYESTGSIIPFVITIKNENGTNQYTDGNEITALRDSDNSKYVKPTSKYLCTILRNVNQVISEIVFVAQ